MLWLLFILGIMYFVQHTKTVEGECMIVISAIALSNLIFYIIIPDFYMLNLKVVRCLTK